MAIEGGNRKGIWAETEPPMATGQESVDLSMCKCFSRADVRMRSKLRSKKGKTTALAPMWRQAAREFLIA